MIKQNLEKAISDDNARVQKWDSIDKAKAAQWNESQEKREADLKFYSDEARRNTENAKKADKASNEALIAAAEQAKKDKEAANA